MGELIGGEWRVNGIETVTANGRLERPPSVFRDWFDTLDWLEARLSHQRFLVGPTLTEADIRLFTTLVRFDAVYHGTSSAIGRR